MLVTTATVCRKISSRREDSGGRLAGGKAADSWVVHGLARSGGPFVSGLGPGRVVVQACSESGVEYTSHVEQSFNGGTVVVKRCYLNCD
jgi:hypothetical protein